MTDKADELAAIALDLVTRVRDEEPAQVHRWLASVVDPADWLGLAVVLACAVPDDLSWSTLTAWTRADEAPPRRLRPHGTPAALSRHHARREPACDACKAYDAKRKRDARAKGGYPQVVVDNQGAHGGQTENGLAVA